MNFNIVKIKEQIREIVSRLTWGIKLFNPLQAGIDDPVGASAVHGIGGIWGTS